MEEEKPFGIVAIILLVIIAVANDVAEIFFDILALTGVGLAGEGIMEPINIIMDFFFSGVFIWKTGFGGGTVMQFVDDLLQLIFVPGRTISVGVGIWIANHPKSVVGEIVTTAADLKGGNLKNVSDDAEKITERATEEAKDISQNHRTNDKNRISAGDSKTEYQKDEREEQTQAKISSTQEESTDSESNEPQDDIMANSEEGNPLDVVAEDLNTPRELGGIQQGSDEKESEENEQEVVSIPRSRKVADINKIDEVA